MDANTGRGLALGVLGGMVGGVLGYFLFGFLLRQGLYAIAMPGALVGLGCGLASRIRSVGLGVASAITSVALGLFIEWRFFPFNADGSLSYFLTHVADLKSATLIFIALSGLFGFWFGIGRERKRM